LDSKERECDELSFDNDKLKEEMKDLQRDLEDQLSGL
jgi:cell division protein FtsB